jgi:hypothetical protein
MASLPIDEVLDRRATALGRGDADSGAELVTGVCEFWSPGQPALTRDSDGVWRFARGISQFVAP